MTRSARGSAVVIALVLGLTAPARPAITLNLQQLPGATGLSLPVAIVDAADGSGRLFIVEQAGRIRIWRNGALLATPFLTIPAAAISCCDERGLLGLAFHPDFEENGYFFVNYTEPEPVDPPSCPQDAPCNQNTVIARFRVQSKVDPQNGSPNLADFSTETRLFKFNQPHANHNGGDLHFGSDGYLYIASGDGGSGGDPHDFGQNTSSLLGKILRIDVDATPPPGHGLCGLQPQAYAAAPGNPYLGGQVQGCDEVWHVGLRNPFRFSFDRSNGDIFIGDVGQGSREEIDHRAFGTAGVANWGWRCYEGSVAHNLGGCGPMASYLFPIHDYDTHAAGRCAVTGGFRYRGSLYGNLAGLYLFADYCTGEIWTLMQGAGASWTVSGPHVNAPFSISSFGEDSSGELYVAAYSTGAIYRVQETSGTPTPTPTPTRTPTPSLTPTRTATPSVTPTPDPTILDVDDDGAAKALTDGVLVLRWFFGFRGAPLIAGAVDPGCGRCTAPAIEGYLISIAGELDIDGDGAELPLTDGVLTLRWLLGFRGSILVSGAVGPGCSRCSAGEIESYLAGL
jgi:glucose/arabinose dehydrogenase